MNLKALLIAGLAAHAGCALDRGPADKETDVNDTVASNKLVVRRFYEEAVNLNRKDLFSELLQEDVVNRTNGVSGISGASASVDDLHRSFEGLNFKVVDLIGEGDRVALRYLLTGRNVAPFAGIPATGTRVERPGINFIRLKDGKIAEIWLGVDPRSLRPPAPSPATPAGKTD